PRPDPRARDAGRRRDGVEYARGASRGRGATLMRRPLRDRPEGPEEDRLFDLMRERAVHGLDDDEMRELNSLAARHQDVDVECYDRAAAALDIVYSDRRCARIP